MESAKKILPYILVAIVFAVGGYFIGKGTMDNQQASLYQAAMTRTSMGGVAKQSTTEPTNPKPNSLEGSTLIGSNGWCWDAWYQEWFFCGVSAPSMYSANNSTQAKFLEANKVTDTKVIAELKKSMKLANVTVPTGANEWHTYTTDYGCTFAVNSAGDSISLGCWTPIINTAQTRN